jgi:hypothetical protein
MLKVAQSIVDLLSTSLRLHVFIAFENEISSREYKSQQISPSSILRRYLTVIDISDSSVHDFLSHFIFIMLKILKIRRWSLIVA